MEEIIKKELMRVLAEMQNLDPKGAEYLDLINKATDLAYLRRNVEGWPLVIGEPESKAEETREESKEEPKDVGQALVKELEKEDSPEPEPVVLTKDVVRAHLQAAADNGIHIQPIIKKFVPEGLPVKFSNVPAEKYADLDEELRNA